MGRTSLKLCGPTAFQYWYAQRMSSMCPEQTLFQTLRETLVKPRDCARINSLQGGAPSEELVNRMLAGPLRSLTPPIHVLVPHREERRPSDLKACHVWEGSLPRGSLVKVESGVYVSSPAFCFLQLAQYLSLIDLIQLGDELCGAYMPYEFGETGTVRCPPLTTKAELRSFAERAKGRRWTNKVVRALRYIVDRSASPQETALEMVLCLPLLIGGNAVPVPEMNRCVDMEHAVQCPWDGDLCMGDLTWFDRRLIVDYNGSRSHEGQRKRDDLRRNRLASVGFKVVDAYADHLSDPVMTETLVGQIMRHLGKQTNRRGRTAQWMRRSSELRRIVSPKSPLACQRVLGLTGKQGARPDTLGRRRALRIGSRDGT